MHALGKLLSEARRPVIIGPMRCPRCQQEHPDAVEECPGCGVIFSRYRPRPAQADAREGGAPWSAPLAWLRERMFEIPPAEDRGLVGVRALFLAVLALWWLRLLFVPFHGEGLMRSVLHLIDLPFHEAGHMLFIPFGDFMHVLGGTLGQLLVPFIVICAFLRQEQPFGAAVGGWWLGQSFLDCAPYIDDARAGVLQLISGEIGQENRESHDWWNLLHRTGLLAQDHTIARACWLLGVSLMLAALVWGGYILWRQAGPRGLWNGREAVD